MKLNFTKIISIIFVSVLISIIYNHYSQNRLSFLREEKLLDWESNSLNSFEIKDSSILAERPITTAKPSDSLIIIDENETIKSFQKPKAIKLDFAYRLFKDSIQFIDARSQEEFAEGHIKEAVNIPFYGSENYLDVINGLNKNDIIVTYCSGADCDISILSGNELFEMGFKRVYVFIDGYDEWTKNNYPTSKD